MDWIFSVVYGLATDLANSWAINLGSVRWAAKANEANAKTNSLDSCAIYFQGGGDVVYTNNQKYNWDKEFCKTKKVKEE